MGASKASGRDVDAEMRVQFIAGLSLGVFGLAALATAIPRAELGLGVAGTVSVLCGTAFVATALVHLHRLRRRSRVRRKGPLSSGAGKDA